MGRRHSWYLGIRGVFLLAFFCGGGNTLQPFRRAFYRWRQRNGVP